MKLTHQDDVDSIGNLRFEFRAGLDVFTDVGHQLGVVLCLVELFEIPLCNKHRPSVGCFVRFL